MVGPQWLLRLSLGHCRPHRKLLHLSRGWPFTAYAFPLGLAGPLFLLCLLLPRHHRALFTHHCKLPSARRIVIEDTRILTQTPIGRTGRKPNSNFELGRGDRTSDWKPRLIPSLNDVRIIQIACGGYHSLALTDNGKVLSWGHGGHGQLGHHSIQNKGVPLVIEALAQENIVFIACGGSSSAAVTDTGKLFMWGNARDCQLGVPGLPDVQPFPIEVKFLMEDEELGPHHVISVAVGASHGMCLVARQCQLLEDLPSRLYQTP